jgi:NAD-dependent deacetylase
MKRIVALTGAGVSKGSGIPTFEDMPGIRDYLTREYFRRDPGGFYEKVWGLYIRVKSAPPNPAHLALAEFQIPVVTMNVDGLHRRAGTRELVEIHGNLEWVFCPGCGKQESFSVIEGRHHCLDCGRVLEPNVILYGDAIKELPAALQLVETAELLLVIGTSFSTSTAGYVVNHVRSLGSQVEVINQDAEHKVPDFLSRQ